MAVFFIQPIHVEKPSGEAQPNVVASLVFPWIRLHQSFALVRLRLRLRRSRLLALVRFGGTTRDLRWLQGKGNLVQVPSVMIVHSNY